MSEEILIPRDFDKGLKKGIDLEIDKKISDNIITAETSRKLYDELVKKVNEQFAEELNKEHDLPIDSTLIDYLLECRKIYRENDIFNKNMSLGSFLQLQLVRIVNKCD